MRHEDLMRENAELRGLVDDLRVELKQIRAESFEFTLPLLPTLRLTNQESSVLAILYRHMGRVVSHESIKVALCGLVHHWDGTTCNHLNVLIHRVRKALPKTPYRIENHHGIGYSLHCDVPKLRAA